MTRAKEELYLCGITGPEQSDSWWNWIKQTTAFVPSDLYDYASPEPAVLVPELQAAQVETAAAREITGTPAPSYSHVALSVTALMVYARCPRCYYLRYILGIPEQIRGLTAGGSVKASSSRLTGLERGNIVHRVCERITDPSQLDDLIELAAALEGVRLSPAQTRDLKNIVQPYLESQFFQRLKQGDVEIHREYNFAVPLGTKFVLNGTVDQVFLGSEGLEIVDFKSNWVSPEQVAEEGEKYRWQLRAYAWAMAKLFARPVVQSQAYFLIPNRVFALTEADLNLTAAEADLMAACEGIIAGERHGLAAFPRDPHCSDCLRWEE